jgi:nucleotide-binding universal stress UspA family protein
LIERRGKMEKIREKADNRRIMIAVDDSENARRAVEYVGGVAGGLPGFSALLLHIIPDPEDDYFRSKEEKDEWLSRYRRRMKGVLEEYTRILLESGFSEKDVAANAVLRFCPSLAACILSEREKAACGTIVVGRQGISRSEEFLFGSTSSRIVHHARDCAVWVVG